MSARDTINERFDEIASAAAADQQVRQIVALAKSAKLERSRGARREAWAALLATCNAHLAELDRIAGAVKRVKKREAAAVPAVPPETPIATA